VSKPGVFKLAPKTVYVTDLGETKEVFTRPFAFNIQPKIAEPQVAGKVATGIAQIDSLLLGGIPERYAVVLTAPSLDERQKIIDHFVETGAKNGEVIFYITDRSDRGKTLAQEFPANMSLFICSPRADSKADLPNVFRLKGVENLTEIDIALAKASRQLGTSTTSSRRACFEIVSDVLLQHHAIVTRKWLGGLIQDLKLNGFTILAVVDPSMHPSEELQAVLGVFDGEIRVIEKETPEGTKQTLKIKRLVNQKYSDKEIVLDKEALSS
jgi:KaiC/GvpD/RAD55 family RecA-like ATPase